MLPQRRKLWLWSGLAICVLLFGFLEVRRHLHGESPKEAGIEQGTTSHGPYQSQEVKEPEQESTYHKRFLSSSKIDPDEAAALRSEALKNYEASRIREMEEKTKSRDQEAEKRAELSRQAEEALKRTIERKLRPQELASATGTNSSAPRSGTTSFKGSTPFSRMSWLGLSRQARIIRPIRPERTAKTAMPFVDAMARNLATLADLREQLKRLPVGSHLARSEVGLKLSHLLADLGRGHEASEAVGQVLDELNNVPEDTPLRFEAMELDFILKLEIQSKTIWHLLDALRQAVGTDRERARFLRLQARLLLSEGKVAASRSLLLKAANLLEWIVPLGVDEDLARTWNDLGQLEQDLGLLSLAVQRYQAALGRMDEAPSWDEVRSVVSSNLAETEAALGQFDLAISKFTIAAGLFHRRGVPSREAAAFNGLAVAYIAEGRPDLALAPLKRALAANGDLGLPEEELRTLLNLAHAQAHCGRADEALGSLETARDILDKNSPAWLGIVLHHDLMCLWAEAGQRNLAILEGKQAAASVVQLHGKLQGMEQRLKEEVFNGHGSTLRGLADLLVEAGRIAEAQTVLRLLKAEELREYTRGELHDAASTAPAFSESEVPWAAQYAKIQGHLGAVDRQLHDLRQSLNGRSAPSGDALALFNTLEAEILRANAEFDAFLSALQTDARLDGNLQSNLRRLEDTQSLERIASLEPGTLVLQYVQAGDHLHIIVTGPTTSWASTRDCTSQTLNRLIVGFLEALGDKRVDPRPAGGMLYDLLLREVEGYLVDGKVKTLVLSLDGNLRYIPFAALWDSKAKTYVAQRWACVGFTEAVRDQLMGPVAPLRQLLAFGMTNPVEGFDALTFVETELESIWAIFPGPKPKLNEAFTLESMRMGLLGGPQVLHISSHFVFRPGSDTESFLLLGTGARLNLRELRLAPINMQSVELLALSACETAVGGGQNKDGREVESLGALLQKKHAKSVLATLWPVYDPSTGAFMEDFYQRLKKSPGITKATALRQAQEGFIKGSGAPSMAGEKRSAHSVLPPGQASGPVFPYDRKAPYAHPYYWAPFILMGNWR